MTRPSASPTARTTLARWLPLGAAFLLGACAATAVTSQAATGGDGAGGGEPAAGEPFSTAVTQGMVRGLEDAPRRLAPNDTATVTVLAHGSEAFVAKLDMQPGAKVPTHRDATEEFIHVLEGAGSLTMDGTTYSVGAGTTIFMPANAQVSFENGDAPFVGIQVFAGPEPAAKYDAWKPVD